MAWGPNPGCYFFLISTVLWEDDKPISLHVATAAFALQQPSSVITTETIQPVKLKRFTGLLLLEKVC